LDCFTGSQVNEVAMKILEYDLVDPLSVLQLNMLALDFALTPEHASHIRRSDPRPFPFFAIYAVEDDGVMGQVGVFRLPMVSLEGREDVGGVWAVCTHPQYAGQGIASCLLEEVHTRMLEAGLRFSTLGTNRYRVAYKLYQKHGYADMQVRATALARWETAHQPTRLQARPPGPEGFDLVEKTFETIASDYLGFAWRHTPFARLREKVSLNDIWILWKNDEPVGYVFAQREDSVLQISLQLLQSNIDAAEAVGAVVSKIRTPYVQVTLSRPSEIVSLWRAGWHVVQPTWGAFMIKPLMPGLAIEEVRRSFGIGTDRFLISWLDTT
jgi:GNAT superfamily N-acetyltransferase